MMIQNRNKILKLCSECDSAELVFDIGKVETYCSKCGLVLKSLYDIDIIFYKNLKE